MAKKSANEPRMPGERELFYSPEHGCNGHLAGKDFVPTHAPEGFECDVEAWKAKGCVGDAPLREKPAVVATEGGDDA